MPQLVIRPRKNLVALPALNLAGPAPAPVPAASSAVAAVLAAPATARVMLPTGLAAHRTGAKPPALVLPVLPPP